MSFFSESIRLEGWVEFVMGFRYDFIDLKKYEKMGFFNNSLESET